MKDNLSLLKIIMRPCTRLFMAALVVQVVVSLINAAVPYFSKLKLDQLQNSVTSIGAITGTNPYFAFVVILAIASGIEVLRLKILDKLILTINARLQSDSRRHFVTMFWNKLSQIDVGFFENSHNIRIINAASRSYSLVQDVVFIAQGVTRSLALLFTVFPILTLVDWRVLAISVFSALVQAYIAKVQVVRQSLDNLRLEKIRQNFWRVDRLITFDIPQIKIMGATEELKSRYATAVYDLDTADLKTRTTANDLHSLQSIIAEFSSLAINLLVGYWVMRGNLSLGTFAMVVSYSLQINDVFRNILDSAKNWQELDLKLEQLRFFFQLKARLKTSPQPIKTISYPTCITLNSVSAFYPDYSDEERKFVNVLVEKMKNMSRKTTFNYYSDLADDYQKLIGEKPSTNNVIKNVSMNLTRGQLVALVGPNGSGKTTLTRLITHTLEVSAGTVRLDGTPVWKFDQDVYLGQFALVQQFPFFLYHFSLRENLTLGIHSKVSDHDIWAVLDEVGLRQRIEAEPDKLEVVLGDGFELSGGQRQLLAIARVLLQNRPFVLMDESTSQLDAEHEAKIMKLLKTKLTDSAVLFITHRLSTARRADLIYVLENGTISQKGTHAQLILQDGLYRRYWHLQTQDQ